MWHKLCIVLSMINFKQAIKTLNSDHPNANRILWSGDSVWDASCRVYGDINRAERLKEAEEYQAQLDADRAATPKRRRKVQS